MERRDCFEDLTKEARDSGPSPGAPTHHKEALLLQLTGSSRVPLGSLLEAPSGVNAFLVSHLSAPSPITFYCHRGSWRKVTLSIWPRTTVHGHLESAGTAFGSQRLSTLATEPSALPRVSHPTEACPPAPAPQLWLRAGAPELLTLLSCWWMSCFSSEAFSGGSDMPALAPRGRYSPPHTVQQRRRRSPSSRPRSISGGRSTKRSGRVRPGRAGTPQPRRHN